MGDHVFLGSREDAEVEQIWDGERWIIVKSGGGGDRSDSDSRSLESGENPTDQIYVGLVQYTENAARTIYFIVS